jgi:hypothetical protein
MAELVKRETYLVKRFGLLARDKQDASGEADISEKDSRPLCFSHRPNPFLTLLSPALALHLGVTYGRATRRESAVECGYV